MSLLKKASFIQTSLSLIPYLLATMSVTRGKKQICTVCLKVLCCSSSDEDIKDMLKRNESEELGAKCREASFLTAISSLSVLRYLSENTQTLPMGITSRLLCSNDVIMALISLIHTPPWVRTQKQKVNKYEPACFIIYLNYFLGILLCRN